MKRMTVFLSLLFAITCAAASAPPRYKFLLSVQVENAPRVSIDATLPLGTTHTLEATQHLRFEVEVPSSVDDGSWTVVRLVDDSSGKPVVLHSARTGGPATTERALAYTICHGQVTFQTGTASTPPVCQK